ncbi:MAG: hypothetical protein ACYCOU_00850 [Sulfobacillus sp.]
MSWISEHPECSIRELEKSYQRALSELLLRDEHRDRLHRIQDLEEAVARRGMARVKQFEIEEHQEGPVGSNSPAQAQAQVQAQAQAKRPRSYQALPSCLFTRNDPAEVSSELPLSALISSDGIPVVELLDHPGNYDEFLSDQPPLSLDRAHESAHALLTVCPISPGKNNRMVVRMTDNTELRWIAIELTTNSRNSVPPKLERGCGRTPWMMPRSRFEFKLGPRAKSAIESKPDMLGDARWDAILMVPLSASLPVGKDRCLLVRDVDKSCVLLALAWVPERGDAEDIADSLDRNWRQLNRTWIQNQERNQDRSQDRSHSHHLRDRSLKSSPPIGVPRHTGSSRAGPTVFRQ